MINPPRRRLREPAIPSRVKVFDARGRVLGRLATEVAYALRGKDTVTWVPHRDDGTRVIVTHTDAVRLTGRKLTQRWLLSHVPRRPGAVTWRVLGSRLARDSTEVVRRAVWNMLPKNRLRHRQITRLELYRGDGPSGLVERGRT